MYMYMSLHDRSLWGVSGIHSRNKVLEMRLSRVAH